MIRNHEAYDGILFFSLYMLPKDRKTRASIYSILQKDKTLHFCLEQLSIQKKKDIGIMEDILQVRQTLSHVPLQGKYQYKEQMDSDFLHFLNIKPNSY